MRIGRFEQCDKGTIFLDEISDMPLTAQAKLLRVLQDGSFERLGSNETLRTDVRVIAASNKNLYDEVKQGRFREDLFHRLNVFYIEIPSLKERREDVPVLAEYFLSRTDKETGKHVKGISPEALDLLISYKWPGNVRELENVLRRAAAVAIADVIDAKDIHLSKEPGISEMQELDHAIQSIMDRAKTAETADGIFHSIVLSVEKIIIQKALNITNSNQVKASLLLGITRNTLRKKIQEYNILSV